MVATPKKRESMLKEMEMLVNVLPDAVIAQIPKMEISKHIVERAKMQEKECREAGMNEEQLDCYMQVFEHGIGAVLGIIADYEITK